MDDRESYKGNKSLLHFVFDRSASVCLRLYSKPEITEKLIMSLIHRNMEKLELELSMERPAFIDLVTKLLFWRDRVARLRDESAEYILANEELLAIARFVPITYPELEKVYLWLSSILDQQRAVPRLIRLLWSSLVYTVSSIVVE